MPSCKLRIELDGHDSTYAPGHVVRGTVHVSVEDRVDCHGLHVQMRWRAEHPLTSSSGGTDKARLFFGRWEPGEHVFPFSIVVPNGPVSYEGQLFRLSWAIRADADLSWKSDPSTTREITIAGGSGNDASSDLEQARSRDMDNNIRVDSGARLPWGVVVAIGVLLLGFGFAGFAIIQWFVQPGYTEELILAIVLGCLGAVLGVVPLMGLIAYSRQREQGKNIGSVCYELSADRVAPGDAVECKVAFTPTQRSITVGPIVATVHAQETVSARRHDEHWSEAKTVHETVLTLTEIQRAEGGVPFVAVGTFRIPEDAPRTIHADHHRLAWEVRIDGKIAEGGALLARRGLLVG